MNDKELIEWAAKAAGLRADEWGWDAGGLREYRVHGVPHCGFTGQIWNPRTDKGDALALAVRLGLQVTFDKRRDLAFVAVPFVEVQADDAVNFDPVAATCLAITRAAAEIGRNM